MDKKRSALNVSVSVFSRVIQLIATLYIRRLLIQHVGNDVNGLNSLYTDIIGLLAVAELGIGSAIIYSMYSPILEGNRQKVTALYCLFKRLYRIIGAVILCAGLAATPFLPLLIKDYGNLNAGISVYLTFILTLISVVISYLYSAKTALIEAHKDNYITTGINITAKIVMYALQIVSILIWRSFTAFVTCKIAGTLIVWLFTEIAARRKYGDMISSHEHLDKETEAEITRNIKAMFLHKVGTIIVSGIDSLIISCFIGVIILGKYNNYTTIAKVVSGTIALCFSPLTSVVGHLCAAKDPERSRRYFGFFYSMNFALGLIFFLGYYAIIDGLVGLCFGDDLEMKVPVVFIITLNHFTKYMRSASLLFRNASGTFYNDRWKPIVEAVANLILSLIFVNILSEEMRVVGVILATIITTLLICHVVEPFIIFRNVFNRSPKPFYIRNYLYIALFTACLSVLTILKDKIGPDLTGFNGILVHGLLSLGVSAVALGLVTICDKEFRNYLLTVRKNLNVKAWK